MSGMLVLLISIMCILLVYLVQSYTAFLTFKIKNIKLEKNIMFLILPFYSLLVHFLIAYKLFKKKEFKKAIKILIYSFSRYNIFLNILLGVILEEIIVLETYGQSRLLSKKEIKINEERKEKTILEKLLKKPFNTAKQVAPLYN
ncbi:cellobiose-specific phosphotransferase system component IIC [Staphylococcus hominis]